jgi:hypothetical protein
MSFKFYLDGERLSRNDTRIGDSEVDVFDEQVGHKGIAPEQSQSNRRAIVKPSKSNRRAIAEQSQSNSRAIAEQSQSNRRAIAEQSQSNCRAIAEQ